MIARNKSFDKSVIYQLQKKSIIGYIILAFFAIIVGFVLNFSIEEKVVELLEQRIKSNRKCPIIYKNLKFNSLSLALNLSDIEVSPRCLKSSIPLKIKSFKTSMAAPSLQPLGPSIATSITDDFSKINLLSVHNLNSHYLNLESKRLNAKSISPFLRNFKLNGNFQFNSNIDLDNKGIQLMSLLLKSKDFKVPGQSIQGLDIPVLPIGSVLIKASIKDPKKMQINQVVIGNETSPIRAKMKGNILINRRNFSKSTLDLTASIKFSQSFIDSFAILNLLLSGAKADENGFYKMKIGGTIASPKQPKFL